MKQRERQFLLRAAAAADSLHVGSGPQSASLALDLHAARERAIGSLIERADRRAADGRLIGVQATLATTPRGDDPLALYSILDGWLAEQRQDPHASARRPSPLPGLPLEPELFSNMLFVAQLGDHEHPQLRRLARALLRTFRKSDAQGLYHFFTSLRFACDLDCTAMAARARLCSGDLELTNFRGIRELGRMTQAILRSAATADVPDLPLHRHVFKVYRDDHEVQGPELDRGLEHDPVAVALALFPVLFELSLGLRRPDELVPLKEFRRGAPAVGTATVTDIVTASLRYVLTHLERGTWTLGTRHHPSPDAFVCAASELVHEFPELAEPLGLAAGLRVALERRRETSDAGPVDPSRPLHAALRGIAAGNLGLAAAPEHARILATQANGGDWPEFTCVRILDTREDDGAVYVGSPLLTAVYCIRALTPPLPPLRERIYAGDRSWSPALVRALVERT